MKLALGTAGWRTNYGSFSHRILNDLEARILVKEAWNLKFEYIDTAPSYGDSEKLLGMLNPNQKIATKVTVDPNSLGEIQNSIQQSLLNLNLFSLPLVFVHNWDSLTDKIKIEISQILQDQIDKKNIIRWGISTYDYAELLKIAESNLKNIAIQINCNILDQRIENISNKVRLDLRAKKVEIWARSIFLQGILINQTVENRFLKNSDVANFFDQATLLNLSPLQLCLNYIKQNGLIDVALLGIFSKSQLDEMGQVKLDSSLELDFKIFQSFDLDLIDPRRWKK